jgi:phosphate transport system substrate-binding protein
MFRAIARIFVCAAVILLLARGACGQAGISDSTKAIIAGPAKIIVAGPGSSKELVTHLVDYYGFSKSKVQMEFRRGDSESVAVSHLLNGADMLFLNGKIGPKTIAEHKKEWEALDPQEQLVGGRSIAIVVHSTNKVDSLTPEQASGLFSGKINDWKVLGGIDKMVRRYGPPGTDPISLLFNDKVLPSSKRATCMAKPSTEELLTAVSSDPQAVAFVNANEVSTKYGSVKMLAIGAPDKAVLPNAETIKDGSYPYCELLMMYVPARHHETASDVAKFITSGDCDSICLNFGVIPGLRAIQMDAIKTFESLYGKAVEKARSSHDPQDQVTLAAQLLNSAKTTKLSSGLLALMCEASFKLGCAAPEGYQTAIEAMQLLASRCPDRKFDCCQKLVDLFEQKYKADKTNENGEKLIDILMNGAAVGENDHKFTGGLAMCRRALALAGEIKSAKLDYIKGRLGPFVARDESIKAIATLEDTIKDNPQDIQARGKLTMLYLTQLDEPARAARYLDSTADEKLRTNIPLATSKPNMLSKEALLKLAEWYASLADDASEGGKELMLRRSEGYYKRFLAQNTAKDEMAARAELGLKKIQDFHAAAAKSPIGPDTIEIVEATIDEWLNLMETVNPEHDALDKEARWEKKTYSIVADTQGTTVLPLPAQPSSDYELAIDFKPDRASTAVTLGVILGFGQDKTMLMFSEGQHRCGFNLFSGKGLSEQDRSRYVSFSMGKSILASRLRIAVTSSGDNVEIIATLNDEPCFKYKGLAGALGLEPRYAKPDLGIVITSGKLTFSRIEIRGAKAPPVEAKK